MIDLHVALVDTNDLVRTRQLLNSYSYCLSRIAYVGHEIWRILVSRASTDLIFIIHIPHCFIDRTVLPFLKILT